MDAIGDYYGSSEEEGAVRENDKERTAAVVSHKKNHHQRQAEQQQQQSNGAIKRNRSSPQSFGKEEKKEENGSKNPRIKQVDDAEASASEKRGEPENETMNTNSVANDNDDSGKKPFLPIKQEDEEEHAKVPVIKREDQASSGYSNKARTSDGAHTSERRGDDGGRVVPPHQHHQAPPFGLPLPAERKGNFPTKGSMMGHFFCTGEIGAGTFSSIHKCINLDFFSSADTTKRRLAAAKVELSSFAQSGVLESEAMILEFLYKTLPAGTVPVYMGHYKSGEYAAIMMEYLPGEDMHHLRETVMAGSQSRRISVKDAVYLTAEVMLPLLQRMHSVGVVHRDVKPSNCVRAGVDPEDKSFCLVDFGLSKSIVVPDDSALADKQHPWNGKDWLRPMNFNGSACFRKEREKADFRGTSMYASPRVHQMKDYCPRDDVWSVLYVFCDLVSGGLPWMSHAANRDRDACQKLKETIHGEGKSTDETEQLLMGDEYHVIKFRNQQKKAAGDPKPYRLPEPLSMSKDMAKVEHLRRGFKHLATLRFWDKPDYDLIRGCIRGFLDDESTHPQTKPIDWHHSKAPPLASNKREGRRIPTWEVMENMDPVQTELFDEVEKPSQSTTTSPTEPDYLGRLPLDLQFRYRQVEQHVDQEGRTPKHVIVRDWLKLVLPLLYEEWDAKKFEEGGHRTATDGYRRETYLQLLRKCQDCAKVLGFFQSPESVFDTENGEDESLGKKRKINADGDAQLTTIARALYGLEHTIQMEEMKRSPPPILLSF